MILGPADHMLLPCTAVPPAIPRGSPGWALIETTRNEGDPCARGPGPRFSARISVRLEGAATSGISICSHETASPSLRALGSRSDHAERRLQESIAPRSGFTAWLYRPPHTRPVEDYRPLLCHAVRRLAQTSEDTCILPRPQRLALPSMAGPQRAPTWRALCREFGSPARPIRARTAIAMSDFARS